MSHTIGQITEDNQKSKATHKSQAIENRTDSDVSVLSDADYEFLFNQLLEGVAHGWHDRRIVKFFDRLGDRGKSEQWVAWLERLRPKMVTLPIQSKRQLGTVMVRLGELTHANLEIGKIGTTSNRIGRELLFGNTKDVVWEYAGPDLVVDAPVMESESEATLFERLPEDFTELGSTAIQDSPIAIAPTAETVSEPESTTEVGDRISPKADPKLETAEDMALELEEPLIDLDSLEDFPENIDDPDLNTERSIAEDRPTVSMLDELNENLASESHLTPEAEESKEFSTLDDEFEFELDSPKYELVTEDLVRDASTRSFSDEEERSKINSKPENFESEESSNLDSVSIDMDRVINLIQEDDKLAKEITQKLNVSPDRISNSMEHSESETFLADSTNLDRSSVELIEGWFNLGLKQVSGGEFDKAISSWEKALNINPNLSEAWHNRGSALGRLGKYPEAVESFQKALEINPHNYQAWNDRAHALYQLKNWAAAADSWSNAIKITPANHLFWYNRGCALEQLERWAESISSYERSLEIKPDFQPARSRYTNLIADNSR